MTSADDVAQLAVDDTYAEFGREATYTPPGGGAGIPCTVIVDLRDIGSRPDDGHPIAGQMTIEVRRSEIAAPAKDGTFAFTAASGNITATVMNRPMLDEENALVWKMWAT